MRFDTRHFRWWWQRRTRGFDDRELWSLDYTIAKFVYPRLKAFRQCYGGLPMDSSKLWDENGPQALTEEVWEGYLDEMLEGFRLIVDEELFFPTKEDNPAKIERGLDLFRIWFFDLWN